MTDSDLLPFVGGTGFRMFVECSVVSAEWPGRVAKPPPGLPRHS